MLNINCDSVHVCFPAERLAAAHFRWTLSLIPLLHIVKYQVIFCKYTCTREYSKEIGTLLYHFIH